MMRWSIFWFMSPSWFCVEHNTPDAAEIPLERVYFCRKSALARHAGSFIDQAPRTAGSMKMAAPTTTAISAKTGVEISGFGVSVRTPTAATGLAMLAVEVGITRPHSAASARFVSDCPL
jgi:hypothetical protein